MLKTPILSFSPHISDELNFHHFKVLYEAEVLTPLSKFLAFPSTV